MIFSSIISLLLVPINFLIGLFPTGTMPQEVSDAVALIAPKFADGIAIFPFFATARTIFFLILGIEIAISSANAYNWILNKLRGSG